MDTKEYVLTMINQECEALGKATATKDVGVITSIFCRLGGFVGDLNKLND